MFLLAYGEQLAIVWPEDTRATRDPFRVVLADSREIREGDRVEGSGVQDSADRWPAGCADHADGVALFNWHEDIVIRGAPGQGARRGTTTS